MYNCNAISLSYFYINSGQFTEDGSFIGQYVPGKLQPPVSPPTPHIPSSISSSNTQQQGSNSAAVATYV